MKKSASIVITVLLDLLTLPHKQKDSIFITTKKVETQNWYFTQDCLSVHFVVSKTHSTRQLNILAQYQPQLHVKRSENE